MKKYTAIYYISRGKSPGDVLYCTKCFIGSDNGLEIHHLFGRIEEYMYDPTGLCLLCRKCHTKAELGIIPMEELRQREQTKIKLLLSDYSDYYELQE